MSGVPTANKVLSVEARATPREPSSMPDLLLRVLSLRYSSWSIRPWLVLTTAGAPFSFETVDIEDLAVQGIDTGPALTAISEAQLARRRAQGSITGLFPVLYVDGTPIHESLAICEWVAEAFPEAGLWPEEALERARARAICCEMVAGFQQLRTHMSCNVFARVPRQVRSAAVERDIRRVLEIWRDSLDASGGPFLFGKFSIADCIYFPVLTRFRTYGVELDSHAETYARELEAHDSIKKWQEVAMIAPRIPVYDEAIRGLGGDPAAMLR
jgi:glutathione S-transferase